jgi:5-methylcytosine-specific restriction enzyme subunit McrC
MPTIFESFLRNFYKIELPKVCDIRSSDIGKRHINWLLNDAYDNDCAMLPIMETDITIAYKDEIIIIDAKYYKEALTMRYDDKKLISGNLYQMFAYLKNAESMRDGYLRSIGILIYPQSGEHVSVQYKIHGHIIQAYTLNLSQPWRDIHSDLLALLVPRIPISFLQTC